MENKDKRVVVTPVVESDHFQSIPPLKIDVSGEEEKKALVEDEFLIDLYKEILSELKDDRFEIDQYLNDFVNMVMNGGDSSSASKEALVNLMQMKNNIADKKTKIADLMTSMRFKDNANLRANKIVATQTNNINIGDRRSFLAALDKYKKESIIKNTAVDTAGSPVPEME
jgi:predicted transcriptional regulator